MDVLINKKYKTYNNFSRYSPLPYYYHTIDNKYVYSTAKRLRDDTPYSIHEVVDGDTLDSIALSYYNNPTYYWIIADYNRILDPYEELKVGSQLKIPSFSGVEFED